MGTQFSCCKILWLPYHTAHQWHAKKTKITEPCWSNGTPVNTFLSASFTVFCLGSQHIMWPEIDMRPLPVEANWCDIPWQSFNLILMLTFCFIMQQVYNSLKDIKKKHWGNRKNKRDKEYVMSDWGWGDMRVVLPNRGLMQDCQHSWFSKRPLSDTQTVLIRLLSERDS